MDNGEAWSTSISYVPLDDVAIDLTVHELDLGVDGIAGLYCREIADGQAMYIFVLAADGSAAIGRIRGRETDWLDVATLDPSPEPPFRLAAACEGVGPSSPTRTTMAVDGEVVARASETLRTLAIGTFGIFASATGRTRIVVDDLVVTRP